MYQKTWVGGWTVLEMRQVSSIRSPDLKEKYFLLAYPLSRIRTMCRFFFLFFHNHLFYCGLLFLLQCSRYSESSIAENIFKIHIWYFLPERDPENKISPNHLMHSRDLEKSFRYWVAYKRRRKFIFFFIFFIFK